MRFCKNCGTQVDESIRFCPTCGIPVEDTPIAPVNVARETDSTHRFDPQDIADNKWLAIFCYFGILTMLFALIVKPDSRFIKYHANQGLSLMLLNMISAIICVVPILGWIAAGVAAVFGLVCTVLGIVNCVKGRARELPLIGVIRIIR